MSGHKRTVVHISEDEYERLHQAEMQQRFQRSQQTSNEKMLQAASQHLQAELSEVSRRQNDYLRHIARLDETIQSIEYEASRTLVDQQTLLLEEINSAAQQVAESNEIQIQQVHQQLFQAMDNLRAGMDDQLASLQSEWAQQRQSRRQVFEYATSWLDSAETLASFIAVNYDHNHFSPGALQNIDQLIQQSVQNLQNSAPEAAISLAQQAYRESSQLRLSLEQAQTEWHALQSQALQGISRLQTLLDGCQTLPALDLNGAELPVLLNIEFWSQGEYRRLFNDLRDLEARVQMDWRQQPMESLNELCKHTLPELQQRLDRMIYQARLAALNSQLRINIADIVIQALETQGFSLQTSAYQKNDFHQPFQAQLRNYEGSQVVVEVVPTGNGQRENELHIHSLDAAQHTPHELRRRALEINRSLNEMGLQTGELETLPPTTSPPPSIHSIPIPARRSLRRPSLRPHE